ncbi:hypothetical protein [Botrimarina mediterranea]|uniref:hypothetical protein n=1 Tax=Botrimarina mediterranea TaxID=2528022 RepID=UPI0011A39721
MAFGLWMGIGLLLQLASGNFAGFGAAIAGALVGLVAAVFMFVIGLAYAGLVAIFTVPICALVLRLLAKPLARDTQGKLAGGLVAYLTTLPAALGASLMATDTFDFLPALFVFAHCGLAIAMGQAAGCLAAVAEVRRRRRGRLTSSGLRFGVWQLLALTVPVAVVLSLLKAADMLNPPMALTSIAAAFCAVATWQPVTWLVNRWLDRRLAKRRRRRTKEATWYR